MNYSREIKKALVTGFLIWGILFVINLLLGSSFPKIGELVKNLILTLVYTVVLYFSNAFLFVYLDKKFKSERFSINRLIIEIGRAHV